MTFVFDAHSDMWSNVTTRRLAGQSHVFEQYHRRRLKEGGVGALIAAVWIEPDYTGDPTARMLDILGCAFRELRENADILGLIRRFDDMDRLQRQGKTAILFGMEGLSGLKGKTVFLEALYAMGVRHAMLTWNEENEFAAGAGAAQSFCGLKPAGIRAVKLMEELGMIVDVSHASEKTFWDIEKLATKPFLASHSNAYSLCRAERNLKDEQLKAIAAANGVVCMNAWPDFVSTTAPSAEKLADHVDYIAELIGIDHIGCGFDFCDYLGDNELSFSENTQVQTPGISHAGEVQGFLRILRERGYSQDDVDKIAYKNIRRLLGDIL